MSDWQAVLLFLAGVVFLYFVYRAGFGSGYQECNDQWSSDYTGDVVPFQWPTCPTCGEGITVHRCGKGMWQSCCGCGFAWCRSPYEAMACTERPHKGEGTWCDGDHPREKVENDVPPGRIQASPPADKEAE